MSLDGLVVAVVGATGGLGRRICSELSDRGVTVVAAGRDAGLLSELESAATVVVLDVRDPGAGDLLVGAAMESHGRLDGVVNASGIVAFGALVDTDDVTIEELLLTNVIGPLWLIRRCLPQLIEHRGFLVNLSAIVAERPMADMVAYSACKGALTAADAALAHELRRTGVRVVDVRPPHTETGLAERPIAGSAPTLPEGLDPEHVARVIVDALASDKIPTELPSSAFAP